MKQGSVSLGVKRSYSPRLTHSQHMMLQRGVISNTVSRCLYAEANLVLPDGPAAMKRVRKAPRYQELGVNGFDMSSDSPVAPDHRKATDSWNSHDS